MNVIDFSDVSAQKVDELYDEYTFFIKNSNDRISQLDVNGLNWDNLMKEQIDYENQMELRRAILNLANLHPLKEIRDKLSDTSVKLRQFSFEQCMRKDVFMIYDHYHQNQFVCEDLTNDQRRHFDKLMKEFKALGLHLRDEKYDRFKNLNTELIRAQEEFNKNCSEHKGEQFFTLEQLNGIDEKWLESRKIGDMYKITSYYSNYIHLMQFCRNRETRKTMCYALMTKCSGSNTKLLTEALTTRKEIASLLDFETYCDYTLHSKMARNKETVMNFLNELNVTLTPAFEKDMNTLSEFARKNVDELDRVDRLDVYDINYYTRLYTEKTLNFSKQELKQYFNLNNVTDGILKIYQRFLGLRFSECTETYKNTFWHEEVRMFEVYDNKSDEFMGTFYMDLHPREGKYGHACMMDVVTKSSANTPVVFMICNFPKDECLDFTCVTTFFHEFGHVMHGICSESTLSSIGGTSCERDFVEAPSQLFEEWCFSKEPLRIMAPNITDEYIEIINKERKIMQSLFYKRQLVFGLYDMNLHMMNNVSEDEVRSIFNDLYKKIFGIELPNYIDMGSSFGHIMGGYACGYYGYLWSLVYAKDMYSSVIESNELNEDIGRRFRKIILSRGGRVDSLDSVREFLGREPNSSAFSLAFLDF